MLGGNTVTSSALSVPSACGIAAEPMKLPGLMSPICALLTPITLASALSTTVTSCPSRALSVRLLPSTFSTVARMRVGGAGAWATAAPAISAISPQARPP